MIFALRYYGKVESRSPQTVLHQLTDAKRIDELRPLISPPQREVIESFLDHMRSETDDVEEAHHLELARAYWQGDLEAGQALQQRDEMIQDYVQALTAGFQDQLQQQHGMEDTAELTQDEIGELLLKVLAETPKPKTSPRVTEDTIDQAFARSLPKRFDFTLQDLDGTRRTLNELKGARVTVVDFWGTWCPPCRMSIPQIGRAHV